MLSKCSHLTATSFCSGRATSRSSGVQEAWRPVGRARAAELGGGVGGDDQGFSSVELEAFAGLVEGENGVFGGCWCMGFHRTHRRAGVQLVMQALTGAGGQAACRPCVRWRRLGGLVSVRRAGRGAEAQEPGRLRRGGRRPSRSPGGSPATSSGRQGAPATGRRHGRRCATGALDLIADFWCAAGRGYPEAAGSGPAGFPQRRPSTHETVLRPRCRDRKIGSMAWAATKVLVEPAS